MTILTISTNFLEILQSRQDDPAVLGTNIFAAQSMRQLAEIFGKRLNDADFASKCVALASEIEIAIRNFAIAPHENFGTTAGTGFIHESFDNDDASKFTRPWFAWANTLFGELIVNLAAGRPLLLK